MTSTQTHLMPQGVLGQMEGGHEIILSHDGRIKILSNFNGSNTFGTMKSNLRQG